MVGRILVLRSLYVRQLQADLTPHLRKMELWQMRSTYVCLMYVLGYLRAAQQSDSDRPQRVRWIGLLCGQIRAHDRRCTMNLELGEVIQARISRGRTPTPSGPLSVPRFGTSPTRDISPSLSFGRCRSLSGFLVRVLVFGYLNVSIYLTEGLGLGSP